MRSKFLDSGPKLTKFGRSWPPLSRSLPEFGHTWPESGRFQPDLVDHGQHRPNIGQHRTKFARFRQDFVKLPPRSVTLGPPSVDSSQGWFTLVQLRTVLVEVGPNLANSGPNLPDSGELWSHNRGQLGSNSGDIGPTSTGVCPNSVAFDHVLATSADSGWACPVGSSRASPSHVDYGDRPWTARNLIGLHFARKWALRARICATFRFSGDEICRGAAFRSSRPAPPNFRLISSFGPGGPRATSAPGPGSGPHSGERRLAYISPEFAAARRRGSAAIVGLRSGAGPGPEAGLEPLRHRRPGSANAGVLAGRPVAPRASQSASTLAPPREGMCVSW